MVVPLSSSAFSNSGMSTAPSIGMNIKTPIMPTMGGVNVTPVMPNMGSVMKTPTAPSIGMSNKTPVAPNLGAKNITPINNQQFGAVNKSTPEMFHGTSVAMPKGTIIKPVQGNPNTTTFDQIHAFATTTPEIAQTYAKQAAKGRVPGHESGQQAIWGVVHNVEPVNAKEMKQASQEYVNSPQKVDIHVGPEHDMYTPNKVSKEGFKVTGVHSLVENPNLTNNPKAIRMKP